MSNERRPESWLRNEIDRLTIERDRYHAALLDARERLWGLWGEARQDPGGTVTLTADRASAIARVADDGWRFRQHGCPRCGMPCKFTFVMIMVGPHIRAWDCPGCGKIGDAEAADAVRAFAAEAIEADDRRKGGESP